jgi:hypothetical protein
MTFMKMEESRMRLTLNKLVVLSKLFCAGVVLLLGAPKVFASSLDCSSFLSMPAEICELSPLIGEWVGSGWYMSPAGDKSAFDSTEEIHTDLDGRILIMHGLQKSGGQIVNSALTIFSYDSKAAQYKFSTYLANGYGDDYEMQSTGKGGFIWKMMMGPTQVRYTVDIQGNTWLETGERSDDGQNWTKFFQQDLRRKVQIDSSSRAERFRPTL